jgi:DNA-binding IclR family transcriptional regulator
LKKIKKCKKVLDTQKEVCLYIEHMSHIVNKSKKPYYKINSAEKTIKILELLGEMGELSVAEASSKLGMNRSTCHRFLVTLRELGYVAQDHLSRYRLSFQIFELGMKIASKMEIRDIAYPYLKELSILFNETINLGCLDNKEIIHIDKINSTEILRIDPTIGSRAPAYCTGLGKAILAYLPKEELNSFLKSVPLKEMTKNTITTKEKLLKEFEGIRSQGFAIDYEELCIGLRCVASPVFGGTDYPLYSVSVAGPVSRITKEKITAIKKEVKRVCGELSKRLSQLHQ